MSKDSGSGKSGGIGFVGLLTILFIGLKLGNVIAWSWLWVLSPIWISVLAGIALVMIVALCYGVTKALDDL